MAFTENYPVDNECIKILPQLVQITRAANQIPHNVQIISFSPAKLRQFGDFHRQFSKILFLLTRSIIMSTNLTVIPQNGDIRKCTGIRHPIFAIPLFHHYFLFTWNVIG